MLRTEPTLVLIAKIDSLIQSNKTTLVAKLSGEASTPFNIINNIVKGAETLTSKMTRAATQNPASQAVGNATQTVIHAAVNNPVGQATGNALSTVTDLALNNAVSQSIGNTTTTLTRPVSQAVTKAADNTKQFLAEAQIKKTNLLKLALINAFFANNFNKNQFDPAIYSAHGFTVDKLKSSDMKDVNDFFDLIILLHELKTELQTLTLPQYNPFKWKIHIELFWFNYTKHQPFDAFTSIEASLNIFNTTIANSEILMSHPNIQALFELDNRYKEFASRKQNKMIKNSELLNTIHLEKIKLLNKQKELTTRHKNISDKVETLANSLHKITTPDFLKIFDKPIDKNAEWEKIQTQHNTLLDDIKKYEEDLKLFIGEYNRFNNTTHKHIIDNTTQLNDIKTALQKTHEQLFILKAININEEQKTLQSAYEHYNAAYKKWHDLVFPLINELLPEDNRNKLTLTEATKAITTTLDSLTSSLQSISTLTQKSSTIEIKTLLIEYFNALKTDNNTLEHAIENLKKQIKDINLKAEASELNRTNVAKNFNNHHHLFKKIHSLLETLPNINNTPYLEPYLALEKELNAIRFMHELQDTFKNWHDVDKKFKELQADQIIKATPKPHHSAKKPESLLPPPLK